MVTQSSQKWATRLTTVYLGINGLPNSCFSEQSRQPKHQASIVLIWGKPFIFCYVYQSTVHKIKLTCHYYTVRSTHTSQGYNQQNRSLFVYIPVQNNYPHFYLKQQAKLDESTNQWTRLQTKKQYLHIQSIVFPWNNMPLLQKLQCKSNTPSIFINCLSFTRDF